MQVAYLISSFSSHINSKREIGLINFNDIFYLTQYIQTSVIQTSDI